ncbi:hypothetical protein BC830DRAFT_1084908 [Chytriomyces sp. MP71]|nr:hypothetical protein BC830DRAFT_1084908 [Chytriomyces sp. MP71]
MRTFLLLSFLAASAVSAFALPVDTATPAKLSSQPAPEPIAAGVSAPANIAVINTLAAPYSILTAPAAAQTATDAFSNFANHVYAVSTSLLGLSSAKSADQIKAMANAGYEHEILESIEAMKMASYTNNNGGAALQALVQNTPCVLNGLQFIANNPTAAVAAKAAALIATSEIGLNEELMHFVTDRDATILPNITALVGPLMPNPIPVQATGSAPLAEAQRILRCAAA